MTRIFSTLAAAMAVVTLGAQVARALDSASTRAAGKPDVLFIAVDDLNDWTGCLGGHPQSRTPNIDRLAARGMLFTRAYCAAPACRPSRTAVVTGRRPSTTGVYSNGDNNAGIDLVNDRGSGAAMKEVLILPHHFKEHGYTVAGCGKIHSGIRWDTFFKHPKDPRLVRGEDEDALQTLSGGPLDVADEGMGDYQITDWAVQQMNIEREQPLFLAVGYVKPHLPYSAPRRYFEQYPLDAIRLPETIENDIADVPAAGIAFYNPEKHRRTVEADEWKRGVQAYLATVAFVDAQIGRLIEGLEQRSSKRDLVIVLWSDHGYHLGEKEKWAKFALWENTTRVPLIFSAPGITEPGSRCDRPVDLLSLYPTLADLCGLPLPDGLDGPSLKPLLENPEAEWDHVAMTTWGRGNHAVRNDHFRYIRYADGSEELYDHRKDPHEWNNLATNPELANVKTRLAHRLPESEWSASPANIEAKKQALDGRKNKRP